MSNCFYPDYPYPGLRPFRRNEAGIFFGREEHTDQLIDRLGDQHFVAVVGPSGCGKSSLVKAGLLPGLSTGLLDGAGIRWRIAELRPGNQPFSHLANALTADTVFGKACTSDFADRIEANHYLEAGLRRGPFGLHEILTDKFLPASDNLLIIVDQFEEIFRYYEAGEINDTAAFVELLLKSSGHPRIFIVITMRADFLGGSALFYGLSEAINQGLFLIPRLTRDQLQEAIEEPVRVYNGKVSPKLVNHLLNDMGNDPDQLPLMQHVLMRMWMQVKEDDKSGQITLTLNHYGKAGKLADALSKHADEAYAELDGKQKRIAEILFRGLTERRCDRRDMRRIVTLQGVASVLEDEGWEEVAKVADVFRQDRCEFLLPSPNEKPTLESNTKLDIIHESLIRQWGQLKEWADAEAESAEQYRFLENFAYHVKDEPYEENEDALLPAYELERLLIWREKEHPTIAWAERYGKDKSKYFKPAMYFLERAKKQVERQKQKKAAIAKEKAAMAEREITLAQDEQEIAQEKAKTARQYLKWAFFGLSFAMFGLLFAIIFAASWAWQYDQALLARQEAEKSQLEAEQAKKERTLSLFDSQLTQARLLARNEDYAAAREILVESSKLDPDIPLHRRQTRDLAAWFTGLMGGAPQYIYQGATTELYALAVDTAGRLLAAGGEDGTLAIFDVSSGELLYRPKGHIRDINALVFDPQGRWLAGAGGGKRIVLWSLPDFENTGEWRISTQIYALAINSEGTFLAGGGDDNSVGLWEMETGNQLFSLQGHTKNISALAFSPSEKLLVSASYDGTVRLWDITAQKTMRTLEGHPGGVESLAFSPDGMRLATGGDDNSVRLWGVASGRLVRELKGHENDVLGIRFAEDGNRLISASRDRTLRVWDSKTGVTLRILQGHTAGITALATHAGQIFSAAADRTVRRWDAALPHQQLFDLPDAPVSVAIAPEGDKAAVGFVNGSLRLYSLLAPSLLWEQETAHDQDIQRLAFSPDGALLASAGFDDAVKLWQVKDNKLYEQRSLTEHTKGVYAIAFSPNGQLLATAGNDGRIGLFKTGTEKKSFFQAHEEEGVNSVAFDPKGSKLVSTGDTDIRLWDINTAPPSLISVIPKNGMLWADFSPDGQWIAAGGRDHLIHVYTLHDGAEQYRLAGHEDSVLRIIFSPGGEHLVSAGGDAAIRLWDLRNGEELFTLRLPAGGPDPLWDFDFRCTPQNCRIAVPLARGKLALYELENIYKDKK
ncbi:MAG: hypothetical protein GY862_02540 [Gammaproteobacteria bacterium]|nr:hypothetical protein [Gammaproteobacteria bacterium]